MKIDLVKLVEEVYKLEGEPKNVNKVFALICLQAFKEQLTLTDVSQQREQFADLLIWYKYNVNKDNIKNCKELAEEYINL